MAIDTLQNFHPIVALAFGTLVGLLAQSISTRLRHNGQWEEMPVGRKWALRSTGALAAYAIGLWVLSHPEQDPGAPYIYRLWLYQLVAAWGGTAVLDGLVQIGMQILRVSDQASRDGGGRS